MLLSGGVLRRAQRPDRCRPTYRVTAERPHARLVKRAGHDVALLLGRGLHERHLLLLPHVAGCKFAGELRGDVGERQHDATVESDLVKTEYGFAALHFLACLPYAALSIELTPLSHGCDHALVCDGKQMGCTLLASKKAMPLCHIGGLSPYTFEFRQPKRKKNEMVGTLP